MALRRLRDWPLKWKWIAAMMLAVCIPLFVTGRVVQSLYTDHMIRQSTEVYQGLVSQVANACRMQLANYVYTCNRICFDNQMRVYLSDASEYDVHSAIEVYQEYLGPLVLYDTFLQEHSQVLHIYYTNQTFIAGYGVYQYLTDRIAGLKACQAALANGTRMTWGLNEDKNIYLARTIRGYYDNKLIGIIQMDMPQTELKKVLTASGSLQGTAWIVDAGGMIVSSSEAEQVGNVLEDTGAAAALFSAQSGAYERTDGTLLLYSGLGGEEPDMPAWRVVYSLPVSEIARSASRLLQNGMMIMLAGLLAAMLIFLGIISSITRRVSRLSRHMQATRGMPMQTLPYDGSMDEIGVMTAEFNTMIRGLDSTIEENARAQKLLSEQAIRQREAELNALQSQVHPHFLFNTLEGIRMELHGKGETELAKVIFDLSRMLRSSLSWTKPFVTLEEEIRFTLQYLSIQKFRYKERISFELTIPDELRACPIPKFSLQPLVENAFKHGLETRAEGGHILIRAWKAEDGMYLSVEDNGVGIAPERLKEIERMLDNPSAKDSGNIGLVNIQSRIRMHYGDGYGLSISSVQGQGTRVMLRLPKEGDHAPGIDR